MAKKDLFNFDSMSLFDFMDDFSGAGEEKAPETEDVDSLSANAEEEDDEASLEDSEDLDSEDLDSEDLDEGAKDKSASKPSTSTTAKKGGKKEVKGTDSIQLPITCYGRNWVHVVNDLGSITYNELVKLLYNEGYKEVVHSKIQLIPGKGFVVFAPPATESDTDVLVSMKKDTRAVVADGMLQMEVGAEDFADLAAEEISVLHLQERWEQSAPEWRNKGLAYDPVSQVAVPVLENKVNSGEEITLPITVIVNGAEVSVTEDMFPLADKITADVVIDAVCEKSILSVCNVALAKRNDSVYMLTFTPGKTKAVGALNTDFAKIGKAGVEKAVELISLPVKVYFVTLNMYFDMSPDMFGGKEKVKGEEIVEVLKKNYSLLRSKDRRLETVYAKEQNLFSVALVSGTKGSAYALPEMQECGLFKMIRSLAELQEVKKEPSYLGFYCPDKGPSQRVEVTPVGTFIGVKGEGRESYLIKSVEFESKLPKIPRNLFDTIVADFTAHSEVERILRIYWDSENKSYMLVAPDENGTTASRAFIHYRFPSLPATMQLVLTVHSHNTMPAYFSRTDDADEGITGIYGVVGNVDTTPTFKFRVGMEGVFSDITFDKLFV